MKFPTAVSLCAYAATREGKYILYQLHQIFSNTFTGKKIILFSLCTGSTLVKSTKVISPLVLKLRALLLPQADMASVL